jgi:hypothetical protein
MLRAGAYRRHIEKAIRAGNTTPPSMGGMISDTTLTRRELRPLAALAMVALIGLTSAGCGANAPSKTGTGGVRSASKQVTDQEKAVKFAECIRAHGVADFPDPNASNDFEYGVSVSPTVWRRATTACKSLQPPGSLSSKRTPKQQSASLKFAQCIRDDGVKDFPDPVNGEPAIDTYKIPSSNRPGGMTILNAAIAKCKDVLGLAAGGQR